MILLLLIIDKIYAKIMLMQAYFKKLVKERLGYGRLF